MRPFGSDKLFTGARSAFERYTIYRDYTDGRIEHWTHSDGDRVNVARSFAEDEVARGRARYVDTAELTRWLTQR